MTESNQEYLNLTKPVICCVGPTASGKSDFTQRLALILEGEVVSADSMQIYRGMDIGTGKLLAKDRLVPHFGLDIVEPDEPYSAALFQSYARQCFADIDKRGKWAFLCGGTGFYVRAAIDAFDFPAGEQINNKVREYYQNILKTQGKEELWTLLHNKDSESAAIISQNDTKRIIRAFELLEEGTTYKTQKDNLAHLSQFVPAIFLGLKVDPDILRDRIDKRVDSMIEMGLIQEVEDLLDRGLRESITAPQAIGYKELVEVLDGKTTLDEAISSIKTATHRYAKRQRTWFRKDKRIQWIDANRLNLDDMIAQASSILVTIDDNLKGAFHDTKN